jgi:hypothetical protein
MAPFRDIARLTPSKLSAGVRSLSAQQLGPILMPGLQRMSKASARRDSGIADARLGKRWD